MKFLIKVTCVAALALITFAPAAMAKRKIIVRNVYTPDDNTVYVTEKTSPDLGIVTFEQAPTETERVYVDGQLVGEEGTVVHSFAIGPGMHKIEYRDADGKKVVWIEPSVRVVKHQTTVIYPQ